MEVSFIHTADLHLGCKFNYASFSSQLARQRRNELWETFNKIVNSAKEKNVNFLFIAGDLIEEDFCDVGVVKRIVGKLSELKNTRVVIVTGNHDPLVENSFYKSIDLPKNIYIFDQNKIDKIYFDELDTVIWGFSWNKKYETKNIIFEFDALDTQKNNILLIHGDVYNRNSQYLPLDIDYISNLGFDYIALGHIHKMVKLKNNVVYPGSPEPLDFGETGFHGIVMGKINNKELDLSFINISKRNFIIKEININPEMNHNQIVDLIINSDNDSNRDINFYRIKLLGIVDNDIDLVQLLDEVKDNFYYVEFINNTEPDYNLDKLKRDNHDNIIGIFINQMEEKNLSKSEIKAALYVGLEALLKEKVNTI